VELASQHGSENGASTEDVGVSLPYRSEEDKKRQKPKVKWQLYYYTMVAAASELANGYDVGAFSFALLYFKEDPNLDLTGFQVAVIVGMFNLVASLGCLVAGPAADWLGRKTSLIGGNTINFVGTLVLAGSSSFGAMFLGRFIMGLGAGIAFMGPELYSSEISPPSVRGLTSTWGELFINIGILLGYLSGWALRPQWRLMIALGAIIPFMAVALQVFIPESPRWLLQKGNEVYARSALRKAARFSRAEEDEQVAEIKANLEAEKGHGTSALRELLCPSKALQHAMAVGWGTAFFQQANGSEAVVYFTPSVLEQIGIPQGEEIYAVTAAVGLCKALFVAAALLSMDRTGRWPLLVASSVGVAAGLLLLACAFVATPPAPAAAAVGLCVFMASFSVGWGPLAGVLLAEVFPLRIRGTAVGIGWSLNRLASGTVALVFVPMEGAIGAGGSFFLFLGVAVAATLFSYFIVPETKGATLEDISRLFEKRAAGGSPRRPLNVQEWSEANE